MGEVKKKKKEALWTNYYFLLSVMSQMAQRQHTKNSTADKAKKVFLMFWNANFSRLYQLSL